MAFAPAAAQAQAPWWHSTPDPDYAFQTAYGTVFAVVLAELDNTGNGQTFSGYFNGNPATGAVLNHTYDKASDSGSWVLAGEVTGPLNLPVPMVAAINVSLDRTRGNYVLTVGGTVGGVPFEDTDRSATNPFYGFRG